MERTFRLGCLEIDPSDIFAFRHVVFRVTRASSLNFEGFKKALGLGEGNLDEGEWIESHSQITQLGKLKTYYYHYQNFQDRFPRFHYRLEVSSWVKIKLEDGPSRSYEVKLWVSQHPFMDEKVLLYKKVDD